MSLSPTQDLLDRIDRLHLMLVSELPTLSLTNSQHPTSILPRITINSVDPLSITNIANSVRPATFKSEAILIDELQQYIQKMEREREILLRSYSIILQLLKHDNTDNETNLIGSDYPELLYND
ncbi:unnamed protein product [Rotaria sordida]|uniref:Uncharacterized protein n=1 Tax=Rotaria sordida TaxID=392033 RepID=A0A813PEP4_9BILA|nr:unnamed protein product [Rotaria sordida]CAF0798693.1 unnamed protein product [Rotaria sordida]CAF0836435.1 unnamed protein product [Rotaria sordida]CAF0837431.1 unnamed protein product [Rotaria sordida]CAF3637734.1 unnamed protein product [Rotaria sordida]